MEFTPFKPVPQVITFVEKPTNEIVTGLTSVPSTGIGLKDQSLLKNKPKPIIGFRLSKNSFIEKYNLRELKAEADTTNTTKQYYYEYKSKTVFELNTSGPVVFMKTDLETANNLLKLNGLI